MTTGTPSAKQSTKELKGKNGVYPEAIREGTDDLTLKACINIDHIEENRWGPPQVDADWHAFCQAINLPGNQWEELYFHYREMSKAVGAKKPSESQKAKVLWAMEAAKDRGEEYYDPPRKDNIFGKGNRQDWSCEKSTSKTQ